VYLTPVIFYFTLAQNYPLYQLVSQWLGYDFYQGDKPAIKMDHHALLKPLLPYADYNAKAAIYGFHGTLKAPFRLKPGISHKQLVKILKHFSKLHHPFACSPLQVQQVDDFLALMPQQSFQGLNNLARDCVQTFDVFRDELAVE
jgi:hypothetical protein